MFSGQKLEWKDWVYLYYNNVCIRHDHDFEKASDEYFVSGGTGDAVCLATPIQNIEFLSGADHFTVRVDRRYEMDLTFLNNPNDLLESNNPYVDEKQQKDIITKANQSLIAFLKYDCFRFESSNHAFMLFSGITPWKPYEIARYYGLGKSRRFQFNEEILFRHNVAGVIYEISEQLDGVHGLYFLEATNVDQAYQKIVTVIKELSNDWLKRVLVVAGTEVNAKIDPGLKGEKSTMGAALEVKQPSSLSHSLSDMVSSFFHRFQRERQPINADCGSQHSSYMRQNE